MTTDPQLQEPLMLQETRQIPNVLRRAVPAAREAMRPLAQRLRGHRPPFAMTLARGSSDHAATMFKYAAEIELGLPVGSLGPSVQTVYGRTLRLEGALVLAVSQSGASPDVVEPLAAARGAGALTLAAVNVAGSPLAEAAEYILPLGCGEEKAVAATKSFLASVALPLVLLAEWNQSAALSAALDGLPDVLEEALGLEPQARELAQAYAREDTLLVLARGLHFGVAQEAALKLKETSGILAEAYSAAEFNHGPKRLVAEGVPLLGFTSTDAAAASATESYVALREAGGQLHTLGPAAGSTLRVPASGHACTDPIVSACVFYLVAAHTALLRGENPDQPPMLSKVTRTR